MPDLPPLTLDPKPATAGGLPPLTLDKPPDTGSKIGALWQGLLHGAGNILYGGAQIGARMPEEGQIEPTRPGDAAQIDQATRARQQAYQASPQRRAHPIASGIGEVAGEVATTAPLMALPGGQATLPGRLAAAAFTGLLAGSTQPVTGKGSFGAEKLKQAGVGAVGGTVGGALGEAAGSLLGKAIARSDGPAVDKMLAQSYRSAVKPRKIGDPTLPQIQAQDRKILGAVDTIINAKGDIKLTDPKGNELSPGRLPQNLWQFSESIDQLKRQIFSQYNKMAQSAGGGGVRVDLRPVIAKLQEEAAKPPVRDLHPGLLKEAEQQAERWAKVGSYTPEEAQDMIQNLNQTMTRVLNSSGDKEVTSWNNMLVPVVAELRQQLDHSIETSQGPGYQALKNQYGSLRSIEHDVAAAVLRDAKNIPGGIGDRLGSLFEAESFIHGLVMLPIDPVSGASSMARGGTIQAARMGLRWLNSPNRAISRLFEQRAASMNPSSPIQKSIARASGRYIPGAGAVVGGVGPQGGTVTNVTPVQ